MWHLSEERCFSAPELVEEGESDVRSDIYSLGVIAKLLFGNRYKVISGKCVRKNPGKRFQTIAEIKRKWDKLFLEWLIPVILFMVMVLFFIGGLIIKDRESQKKENEILKNEISLQKSELKEQKESFVTLRKRYEALDDSIKVARQIQQERETAKRDALENFSKKLVKMTAATTDSLRSCSDYFEMSCIRLNYMNRARILYEKENKIINGEDLTPQLYSVLITEMGKIDKEFDNILKLN